MAVGGQADHHCRGIAAGTEAAGRQQGEHAVVLLAEGEAELTEREVAVGLSDGLTVEILSGLEEGDEVEAGEPLYQDCVTAMVETGREIRVIVDANRIDDRSAAKTAWEIAKRIEQEMTYPGEVKVTLIRETRSVEFAR